MSDFEKFKEGLPSKERFYKEYLQFWQIKYHVQKVWNKLEMKTMIDYHDLYLCDILLLVDMFEKFRRA